MSIPTPQENKQRQFESLATKLKHSAERDAYLLAASYNALWSGDTTEVVQNFSAFNTYAQGEGMTAQELIAAHGQYVDETIGRVPSTAASLLTPPVAITTMFTASGDVDLVALEAALVANQ